MKNGFFGFLLGLVVGMGAIAYLFGSGAGDVVINRTPVVQDLQRELGEVKTERDQLGRQLEEVNTRAGRLETAFIDLERRFRDLQQRLEAAPAAAPIPTPAPTQPPPAQ